MSQPKVVKTKEPDTIKKSFTLFGDKVAFVQLSREFSFGGIALPDSARKQALGRVIAIGNGSWNPHLGKRCPEEIPVEPGDIILFSKKANLQQLNLGQGEVHIMRASDITGKIEEIEALAMELPEE